MLLNMSCLLIFGKHPINSWSRPVVEADGIHQYLTSLVFTRIIYCRCDLNQLTVMLLAYHPCKVSRFKYLTTDLRALYQSNGSSRREFKVAEARRYMYLWGKCGIGYPYGPAHGVLFAMTEYLSQGASSAHAHPVLRDNGMHISRAYPWVWGSPSNTGAYLVCHGYHRYQRAIRGVSKMHRSDWLIGPSISLN